MDLERGQAHLPNLQIVQVILRNLTKRAILARFHRRHLYKLFMNSLHPFYTQGRNLLVLTICLPKLLTDAVALEGQRGGTNRLANARQGAHREIHVGHFFV